MRENKRKKIYKIDFNKIKKEHGSLYKYDQKNGFFYGTTVYIYWYRQMNVKEKSRIFKTLMHDGYLTELKLK